MNDLKTKAVESFLAKPDVHQKWVETYYTEDETFYEQAINYITSILKAPKNSIFLDAGCGNCAHSIRLANRGFFVQAIDFSEAVIEMARENVNAAGLEEKISIKQENILNLPFENETFNYILCWGVLMHIPDLDKAMVELTRVLKPGGTLVISELNMYTPHSIILRNIKRFVRKKELQVKKTPAGIEYWSIKSNGTLLKRQANIYWLIERFKSNGFTVTEHVAGQFTEVYTRVTSRLLKNFIHGFNKFWFRYIKIPYFALSNIIILQKEK